MVCRLLTSALRWGWGQGLEPQGLRKGHAKEVQREGRYPGLCPLSLSWHHDHSGSHVIVCWETGSEIDIGHHSSLGIRSLGSHPSSVTRCGPGESLI